MGAPAVGRHVSSNLVVSKTSVFPVSPQHLQRVHDSLFVLKTLFFSSCSGDALVDGGLAWPLLQFLLCDLRPFEEECASMPMVVGRVSRCPHQPDLVGHASQLEDSPGLLIPELSFGVSVALCFALVVH